MRLLICYCGLLAWLLPTITATALTYKLVPNEKACFYSYADQKGQKLAFYFAVRPTYRFPTNARTDASFS